MKLDPRFADALEDLRLLSEQRHHDEDLLDQCDRYADLYAEYEKLLRNSWHDAPRRAEIEAERMRIILAIIPMTARSGLGRQSKWNVLGLLLGRGTIGGELADSVMMDYDSFALQKRAL